MDEKMMETNGNMDLSDSTRAGDEVQRKAVLERLADGEIDVDTAASLLRSEAETQSRAALTEEQTVRMNILERIELGEMEADEALEYLSGGAEDEPKSGGRMDLLEQIEDGSLTTEEAVHLLGKGISGEEVGPEEVGEDEADRHARESLRRRARWGLLMLSIGLSAVGGWLASLGGWWWAGAVPLLLLGVPLLVLVVVSWRSLWLFVNVRTTEDWPRWITICFPMPLRLTGWVIRSFGGHIQGLSGTAVDELLVEMENCVDTHQPIAIDIDETDTGESVQVYLG